MSTRVYLGELILGHSFVRRLQTDLLARFDKRAAIIFNLQGTADIHLYSVGGRTVPKLRKFDLWVVSKISPSIVIIEIGTNYLANTPPGRAQLLNRYTRVVLEPIEHASCWTHRGFTNLAVTPYLSNRVHFNHMGQYMLYGSYCGVVKHALKELHATQQQR